MSLSHGILLTVFVSEKREIIILDCLLRSDSKPVMSLSGQ